MQVIVSDHTKATERPMNEMNLETPFIDWFARHAVVNEAEYHSGDIKMGPAISRRLSIGIDDNLRTIIGMPEYEMSIFESFDINKVLFAKNMMQGDWLIICTPDLTNGRDEDPLTKKQTPMPIRIWIPVSIGLLDGWYGTKNDVFFCETVIRDGVPFIREETPFASCPLEFIGNWAGIEEIEDREATGVDVKNESEFEDADATSQRHGNNGNVVPELSLDEIELSDEPGIPSEEIDIDEFILGG